MHEVPFQGSAGRDSTTHMLLALAGHVVVNCMGCVLIRRAYRQEPSQAAMQLMPPGPGGGYCQGLEVTCILCMLQQT